MIEWHSPSSRVIAQIGHDPETNELHVQWAKGGKVSVYTGVHPEAFEQGVRAPSVGQWLHETIKPNHPHRYAE